MGKHMSERRQSILVSKAKSIISTYNSIQQRIGIESLPPPEVHICKFAISKNGKIFIITGSG